MKKSLLGLFSVCVSFQIVLCQTGNSCVTVDGGLGNCILLTNCQQYWKLIVDRSNTDVLRKAHCGFEGKMPKVCCPPIVVTTTTTTPSVVRSKLSGENFVPALPDPPICGLSNASFSRIIEGVDAKLGDFPWMALLGFKFDQTTTWGCGGSLITSRHVITAAHCIHNYEDILYVVRLGELDLAREDEGATPMDFLIKNMIKHEQYSRNKVVNDIGILILDKDVQFTELIRPICIPKESQFLSETFENYTPLVAGWGRTKFDGLPATRLQVVQLPVISTNICAESYAAYKQVQFDNLMCAGLLAGGKDACKGDSGGPLMQPIWSVKDKKLYFYNIGIVSFGIGCAKPKTPGVYTRVTRYVPWIKEKVLGQVP